MRDRGSKSNGRQRLTTPSPSPEEHSLINIELSALKMKNTELTRVNTKLKMDNADLRNQIYDLQAENVSICTKYNNIKRVYKTLQDKLKSCTPACLDFLNLLLQITGQDSEMNLLSPGSSKVSLTGAATPVKTQTVKPHTVNGTVLHRPTISLTRLGIPDAFNQPSTSRASNNPENIENVSPNRGSNRNPSRSPRCSGPDEESNGGSVTGENGEGDHISFDRRRVVENGHLYNRNEESDSDSEEEERQEEDRSFFSRRTIKKRPSSTQPEPNDSSDENENEENQDPEEEEEECIADQEGNEELDRLSTINEENEITIILPRLSDAQLATALSSQIMRQSFNDSTEPQSNDSYLDMTLADESMRASKRLRVELTVFEPRGNSTTFGTTGCSPKKSLSPALTPSPNRKRTLMSGTDMSRLEVTPDCPITENGMTLLLNTPSASAMGDINPDSSKLTILEGLGLCPTPTELLTNCPDTPKGSAPRTRRTRKSRDENIGNNLTSPPLKRISYSTRRRVSSNVSQIKSPIIVLERMEKSTGISKMEINAQVLGSILNTAVVKKSNEVTKKRGKQSKSRKGSACSRNSKQEEEPDENVTQDSLQDKIREVQRRLSSYNPKQSEESQKTESPSKRCGRPTRAAKPKGLKEPSSKVKLRRM